MKNWGPRHNTGVFPLIFDLENCTNRMRVGQNVLQGSIHHFKRLHVPMTSFTRDFCLLHVFTCCTFTQSFHTFTSKSGVACLRCAQRVDEGWTQPDISKADIISQGVVLLAQPSEYDYFLIKTAVFVYDFGSGRGSKGVILERATAFSMGETSPNSSPFGMNKRSSNNVSQV